MSGKMKFGLVGAGAISQAYVQAMTDCTIAEIAGVADIRTAAAEALAQGAKCPAFDSHTALADGVALDAVILCTPPITHERICVDFLERRIPVLCEKPLAVDVGSAKRMLEAAERSGTLLTMATKFRYAEDVVRAKSLVASGVIGEITLFENAFTSRVDMRNRWNSDPAVSGGGVLIDNGTHSVDLMRYFLGPLADVQVVEGKRVQGLAVEETVHIFARSVRGVLGSIDLSWSINKELDSFLNLYGSEGTIRVGWRESKYRTTSSNEWVVFGKGYNKVQSFRSQIENFVRRLRGEEDLVVTSEDALASVAVVEAAYHALHVEHWAHVRDRSTEQALSL